MNREAAIRCMMITTNWRPKDCVELVCRYIGLVRGEVFPYPHDECVLSKRSVTRVLEQKPHRKGEYGDIFLYDGGLGISLGYCAVLYCEQNNAVVLGELPLRRALYWRP